MNTGPAALLVLFAASAAMPCHAAAPSSLQFASVQPLGAPQPSAIALTPSTTVSNAGALIPAPIPDPDLDPPNATTSSGPSVSPALISPKLEFQGNGFAHASSLDYGLDQRRQPAAGLTLHVPVVQ